MWKQLRRIALNLIQWISGRLTVLPEGDSKLLHLVAKSIGVHPQELSCTSWTMDLSSDHPEDFPDVLSGHLFKCQGLLTWL